MARGGGRPVAGGPRLVLWVGRRSGLLRHVLVVARLLVVARRARGLTLWVCAPMAGAGRSFVTGSASGLGGALVASALPGVGTSELGGWVGSALGVGTGSGATLTPGVDGVSSRGSAPVRAGFEPSGFELSVSPTIRMGPATTTRISPATKARDRKQRTEMASRCNHMFRRARASWPCSQTEDFAHPRRPPTNHAENDCASEPKFRGSVVDEAKTAAASWVACLDQSGILRETLARWLPTPTPSATG